MVDDRVLLAGMHDAASIAVPVIISFNGRHYRAHLVESEQEWLQLVLRESPPALHPEARAASDDMLIHLRQRHPLHRVPDEGAQASLLAGSRKLQGRGTRAHSIRVRDLFLGHHPDLDGIVHGKLCSGALTAAAAATFPGVGSARDELLHREGAVPLEELGMRPQGRGRGECPAATTRTLVPDVLHGLEVRLPVHGPRELGDIYRPCGLTQEARPSVPPSGGPRSIAGAVTPQPCKLLIGAIGKLVDDGMPSALLPVMILNSSEALLEEAKA
mmetsp:Transcript_16690/g.35384  ORF Transcript_16690/g.35384 Transcript_16690/m.35384 type:complete len:272 (+) Transcript_16690:448-1263(+)